MTAEGLFDLHGSTVLEPRKKLHPIMEVDGMAPGKRMTYS